MIRINALSIAKLMSAILDDAHTTAELVELTGLHKHTVQAYIRALRREKACYVGHWEQDARGAWVMQAWRIGRQKDAAKPKTTRTSKARSSEWRKRRETVQLLRLAA